MMKQETLTHIEIEQFEELKALLEEDFEDLINTYILDSEKRLQELQQAFDTNNNTQGFESSHSLKGASINLGANHLAELCYIMQEICRGHRIHEHQQLIDEIKQEAKTVNQMIKELLA